MKRFLKAILWGLFIVVVLAGFFHYFKSKPKDPRVMADGYGPDYAVWGKEYWKEFDSIVYRWEPYVDWRVKPFLGNYIHVDENGLRQTWNDNKPSKPITIFLYGGSTAWGVGARDDATIPSLLSRDLSQKLNVKVTNFGQPGYQNTQDFLTWLLSLRANQKPDIAIFYDGVNDVSAGMLNEKPGLTMFEKAREKEFNILQPYRRRELIENFITHFNPFRKPEAIHRKSAIENEQMADGVLKTYLSNLRLIHEIATDHQIKTLFYWHPFLYSKRHLTPYEKSLLVGVNTNGDALICGKIDQSKALKELDGFHNISHQFDDYQGPIFADFAHLTEHGNEVIAKRIAQDVLRLK